MVGLVSGCRTMEDIGQREQLFPLQSLAEDPAL